MSEVAWIGVVAATLALALVVFAIWVRVRRRRRRLPTRLSGVRIEALPIQCVEDLVLERVWRIPLLMTNVTKRPAPVPVLAARSEIRAARRTFAASTSLETDAVELNPGTELVGWVEARLPAEETPRRVTLAVLGDEGAKLTLTAKLSRAHDVDVSVVPVAE